MILDLLPAFRPFERTEDGLRLNPQFNAEKMSGHPFVVRHRQEVFAALGELFAQLDACPELGVPKSALHPKLLKPLLDDRLTGLSFLNLMAYHMVKIVEREDDPNAYTVMVDQNVIAGMPNAYQYICKFIRFAREYNERTEGFTVQFALAITLDSPVSGRLAPVDGAAVGRATNGMCAFTVQDDGTITDGAKVSVKTAKGTVDFAVGGMRQPEPEELMTIQELEGKLSPELVNNIREYAKEVLEVFKKIPEKLDMTLFDRLRSTNTIIGKMKEALKSEIWIAFVEFWK